MRTGPDALECPLSGEHVEILRRPDDHGEQAERLITLAGIGSGPGPHLHPEQVEQFRVVRGRVQVLVGADTVTAGAGQDVIVPAGTAHSFRALEAGTQLRLRSRRVMVSRRRSRASSSCSTRGSWDRTGRSIRPCGMPVSSATSR